MKWISVRQPWAWAIIYARKDVENRDWGWIPTYRGPLAIHAGTQKALGFDEACEYIQARSGLLVPRESLQYGGIIGVIDVTDAASEYHGHTIDSPWWMGPTGLYLENPRPTRFVPMRGQLGLLELPPHIEQELQMAD